MGAGKQMKQMNGQFYEKRTLRTDIPRPVQTAAAAAIIYSVHSFMSVRPFLQAGAFSLPSRGSPKKLHNTSPPPIPMLDLGQNVNSAG
jgi:hypothetical protein